MSAVFRSKANRPTAGNGPAPRNSPAIDDWAREELERERLRKLAHKPEDLDPYERAPISKNSQAWLLKHGCKTVQDMLQYGDRRAYLERWKDILAARADLTMKETRLSLVLVERDPEARWPAFLSVLALVNRMENSERFSQTSYGQSPRYQHGGTQKELDEDPVTLLLTGWAEQDRTEGLDGRALHVSRETLPSSPSPDGEGEFGDE